MAKDLSVAPETKRSVGGRVGGTEETAGAGAGHRRGRVLWRDSERRCLSRGYGAPEQAGNRVLSKAGGASRPTMKTEQKSGQFTPSDSMKEVDMHICFFSGDITRAGGTERVSTQIANALTESGRYRISFVSLFEQNTRPAYNIDEGISRHVLYNRPVRGVTHCPQICTRLAKLVVRQHIDVIIDIDCILDMYSLAIRKFVGVKVISWEHFNFLQNPDVPFRKYTRQWAAKAADAIVTLTATDVELYTSHLKVKCPILEIPNPMDMPQDGGRYDASSHMLVSCGRFVPQKGFDMLVQVAKKVMPSHPSWRWVVLGDGPDRVSIQRAVDDCGLHESVVLPGQVSDLSPYWRKSSIFVLTSRFEGLPMVMLEAKAYGIPSVSFDCATGPKEIIEDGINGFLVPPCDIDGMAVKLSRLMDDEELRVSFSVHALDGAEKYQLSHITDIWHRLLSQVTGDKPER